MITKTLIYETKLSLHYHSSLPIFTESYDSSKILTNSTKKKLLVKNFLLFTCLISSLVKQHDSVNSVLKIKTSVLLNKTKILTHLRAPFRHKLTKKHTFLRHYKLSLVLNIKTPKYLKSSILLPTYELQQFINYFKPLETNILTTHRIQIERMFALKKKTLNLTTIV